MPCFVKFISRRLKISFPATDTRTSGLYRSIFSDAVTELSDSLIRSTGTPWLRSMSSTDSFLTESDPHIEARIEENDAKSSQGA